MAQSPFSDAGYSDDDPPSRRGRSRSAAQDSLPASPGHARKGKAVARPPVRARGTGLSRGASMEVEGLDAPTPGGSALGEDEEEEEEEPVELDEDDLDPINSGAVTPAVVVKKSSQFTKRKETKTIKGQTYTIIDDEITLEDDARGEAKIDADGNLLGGRQFKLATFTSPVRKNPNKHYMLSIDAARAAGFRDSLYFFRRNPLIHKLGCSQPEKDRLIELGKLSGNLKSRAVTMVSARNCFKVMGAAFVLNGKYVFDDYYEDKAIAAGHKPGEPAWIETYDPVKDTGTLASAKGPAPAGATGTGLNTLLGHSGKPRPQHQQPDLRGGPAPRDDYITSQVGGGMHAVFGGSGLQPFGKTWDAAAKKAKPPAHLTPQNWMSEYAKSVGEANRELGVVRKMNVGQVQVGLGVVEREEDMWIEVEEEDEVVEPVEGAAAVAMDVDGVASTSKGLDTPLALDSAVPRPLAVNLLKDDSAAPSPAAVASPAPGLSRAGSPAKKRMLKVYNPIRGIYEPETNVPHVFASTQPTRSSTELVDLVPHVFEDDEEVTLDEERSKRRKLEVGAAKAGVASVEYVVDDSALGQMEALLPGIWDFRPMELRGEQW